MCFQKSNLFWIFNLSIASSFNFNKSIHQWRINYSTPISLTLIQN